LSERGRWEGEVAGMERGSEQQSPFPTEQPPAGTDPHTHTHTQSRWSALRAGLRVCGEHPPGPASNAPSDTSSLLSSVMMCARQGRVGGDGCSWGRFCSERLGGPPSMHHCAHNHPLRPGRRPPPAARVFGMNPRCDMWRMARCGAGPLWIRLPIPIPVDRCTSRSSPAVRHSPPAVARLHPRPYPHPTHRR
jgi:hypothetical protein